MHEYFLPDHRIHNWTPPRGWAEQSGAWVANCIRGVAHTWRERMGLVGFAAVVRITYEADRRGYRFSGYHDSAAWTGRHAKAL